MEWSCCGISGISFPRGAYNLSLRNWLFEGGMQFFRHVGFKVSFHTFSVSLCLSMSSSTFLLYLARQQGILEFNHLAPGLTTACRLMPTIDSVVKSTTIIRWSPIPKPTGMALTLLIVIPFEPQTPSIGLLPRKWVAPSLPPCCSELAPMCFSKG